MLRFVVLALVLCACSIDNIDLTGKRCPCPSGWQCAPATNTCTRELPVVDASGDHDAVSCPGHDEDGDGRGDACDVCPGDADNGQDSDNDGVGDVCDPSPTTRERIAFFHGFDTLPAWTTSGTGGMWRQVGDDIVSDSGAGLISNFTILDPAQDKVSYLITRVTLGARFDPQGSTSYVSLVRQYDMGIDNNIRCVVSIADLATQPYFGLRETGGVNMRSETPHPYEVGQVERFQFKRDGNDYECANTVTTRTGTATVAPAQPYIGLRTRSGAATFHWVMLLVRD